MDRAPPIPVDGGGQADSNNGVICTPGEPLQCHQMLSWPCAMTTAMVLYNLPHGCNIEDGNVEVAIMIDR